MQLDAFDYLEPRCPLTGGKEFYGGNPEQQCGSIPVEAVIEKLDGYLNREQYEPANRLLYYWLEEARALKDRRGELSILSEIMGLSRRRNDRQGGLQAVKRGFALLEELKLQSKAAGTIWLNGATTLKAFGNAEESVAYYEKAYENLNQYLPKEDPLWGGFFNNYALALADLDRFKEAEHLYFQAIAVMEKQENGGLEIAVTLLNLAETYERAGEPESKIEKALEQAQEYLDDTHLVRNGYYAFVCRKCAPTFGHFGWFLLQRELNERADRIYAGT